MGKPALRQNQRAFTLVELVASMLVLAIVASIALPSFNSMILNSRASTLGEDLNFAFNYARSEAVKRATRISLCASSNGTGCTGETDWKSGFIVYVDGATSDTAATSSIATDAGGNSLILKYWNDLNTKATISVKRNSTTVGFVRFTGFGVLARDVSNPVDVVSSVQGCTGDAARNLTINLAGQIRVAKALCP